MGPIQTSARYREIARILTKNGFDWMWSRWGIGGVLGHAEHLAEGVKPSTITQPERLRLTLEELGTTFIKIGQVLSTRPDLVPAEYIAELSKLQDHAPQVRYADIRERIGVELGGPPETVFQSFDPTPLAAASIAQVHRAVLPDGTPVVVKVRKPGIDIQIEQDLAILGHMARFLSNNTDLGKRLDLSGLVDEFAFTLRNELDLLREGQNAERIAANFDGDAAIHVPKIYWEFSSHGVLTLQEMKGLKIDDLEALNSAGIDRKQLAKRCAHIALKQILDHGFFHADPHPGNFFVYPDATVALIDYGMVGRLDSQLKESLIRIVLAITHHDIDQMIDSLLSMGAVRGTVNRQMLKRDLDHLLVKYDDVALGEISAGQVFRDITVTAQKHGLTLPSDLIMVARVIAMDEGMGANLDPDFNLIQFSKPYFMEFWKKSHSVNAMMRRFGEGAFDIADIGLELPHRLLRLMGAIERGELRVVTSVDAPESITRGFQQAANRVAISILTAGLVVGLSVLAVVFRPSGISQIVPPALLVIAMGSSVWLLIAFWKSSRG